VPVICSKTIVPTARILWIGLVVFLSLMTLFGRARAERETAVKKIAAQGITITTDRGSGEIPLDATHDLQGAQPEVTRAVLVVHGKHRNVEGYFDAVKRAARTADARDTTLILAPQFLNEIDVSAHRLSGKILRWTKGEWSAGEDAEGPAPISSFAVVDQLLAQLIDKKRFPNLRQVVVAGHSGGGQFVQRYALIGRAPDALKQSGISVRFVVANPSSYFYFSDERPTKDGSIASFTDADSCKNFDRWRYGPRHAPPYANGIDVASLERSYFAKDITYLLGTADTDPNHPDLDKSCAGEAQGSNRLDRGKGFFRYAQLHHADPAHQRFWLVPGVAHDDTKMFNSDCGIAALFDTGGCKTPLQ
jgi:pimeloyl-ACP methyl ester carboxylesterase